jgi:hypothetical protein
MTRHLDACHRCRQEIDALRCVKGLLQQAIVVPADPDWTGFWPGIVRSIADGTASQVAVARRRRWQRTGARWGLSGVAAAAVVVLSVGLWYQGWAPRASEESVVVTAANTQYPGGTMVYHTPDKVAVVWVFDE